MEEGNIDFYMMPLDYLITLCFLLISMGIGVLGYRVPLRNWVRSGNHPFSLRILMALVAAGVFLFLITYWFWKFLPSIWHWKYEDSLGPLIIYIVFGIWLIIFFSVIFTRKKSSI